MCISKSFAREKKFCSGVEKKNLKWFIHGRPMFSLQRYYIARASGYFAKEKKMFILLRWLMNSLNFCINRRSPFFYYKAIEMEFDLWSSFCNKNRSMPTEKYRLSPQQRPRSSIFYLVLSSSLEAMMRSNQVKQPKKNHQALNYQQDKTPKCLFGAKQSHLLQSWPVLFVLIHSVWKRY